jgi:hypothetical protein
MVKKIIKKNPVIINKDIIFALGVGKISPAKQKKIIKKLEENIQRKIVLAVLENLSEDEIKVFKNVSKLKDKEAMIAFIDSVIPDVREFIRKISVATIEEFKKLSAV